MTKESLLLLLLTACVVRGGILQFLNMIVCVQPDVNPLAYSNYGCYCDSKGTGTPVDGVDKCCQTHSNCYEKSKVTSGCTFLKNPFLIIYKYSCDDKQVTCSDSNGECQAAVCECDKAAAECFSQNTYNPQNKNLDFKASCDNTGSR